MNFGSSITSKTVNYIKSYDEYGQPISLNYQGSETFQTLPGGLLSLVVRIILISYTILKFSAMTEKKDWSIIQQTIVTDIEDIKQPKHFKNFTNVTMALQISKKREKEVNLKMLEMLDKASGRKLQDEVDFIGEVEKYFTV